MKFNKDDLGCAVEMTQDGVRQNLGSTRRVPEGNAGTLQTVYALGPFIKVLRTGSKIPIRYHENFWDKIKPLRPIGEKRCW